MKSLVLALAFLAAPACKKEPTTPTTTTLPDPADPAAKPPAAGGMGFTLVEMKLFIGSDLGLQVHSDGRIEGDSSPDGKNPVWVTMATITKEGKLIGPEGKEVGGLEPDGQFKFGNGDAPFKFEGPVFVTKDRRVSIDDKGVLQGIEAKDGIVIRVEGITDDGSRRAAIFAFALAMMSGGGEAPPPQ